jgi:hypothetical protein
MEKIFEHGAENGRIARWEKAAVYIIPNPFPQRSNIGSENRDTGGKCFLDYQGCCFIPEGWDNKEVAFAQHIPKGFVRKTAAKMDVVVPGLPL